MASIKAELHPKNFGLGYHRGDVFYRSQWGFPHVVFVVYRVVVALYMFIWWILSVTYYKNGSAPFIVFLTHCSFIVLWCHLLVAAGNTLLHCYLDRNKLKIVCCSGSVILDDQHHANSPDVGDIKMSKEATDLQEAQGRVRWYMQIDWVLYSISTLMAFAVTLMYFVLLYRSSSFPEANDFHLHAFNSVVALLEIILSAMPMRIYHFIYPVIFCIIYLIITVIYWAVDNNNTLYGGMIDWNNPGSTALLGFLLTFIGIPVLHLILFGFYKLKLFIASKVAKKGYDLPRSNQVSNNESYQLSNSELI